MAKRKRNVPKQTIDRSPQNEIQGKGAVEMDIKIDEKLVRLSDEELRLLDKIQEIRGSKILTFIASDSAQMRDDVPYQAYMLLRELGKTERIDMILNSRGGQTEVPAKLVPLIRNYCDHFGVIIPYRAHSAATHIALGANEIVMGPMSELGPVDPSRTHALLPKDKEGNPIPISVQDLKHVVDLLKREGPEQSYTPEALATIFSTMFEYVHPLAMGAIEQSYALSKLISKKLLATHIDPKTDEERIDRIANELSDGFKSHLYQIGWREATELGLPILFDEGEIYESAWKLYELYSSSLNDPPIPPAGAQVVSRPVFILGTEKSKRVLYEIFQVIKDGDLTKLKPLGAKWISSNDIKPADPGEKATSVVP